jgi:hypothetical protein
VDKEEWRDEETNMSSTGLNMTSPRPRKTYGVIGILSALFSLIFLAEAFGSAAIILGAYQWKIDENSNFGLMVIIIGILAMFVGVYFTAYPDVIDLLFSL